MRRLTAVFDVEIEAIEVVGGTVAGDKISREVQFDTVTSSRRSYRT